MKQHIDIIRKTREMVLRIIDGLTVEQLNTIPDGFNNNIIWNIGHMIAAQQGVCYRRAGVEMILSEDFFTKYKPESKPEGMVSEAEIAEIKELLFSTLDRLESDLTKNMFPNYPEWTTRYGVSIASIEDAVAFLPFHEGMHTGYIMALKRVVSSKVMA